MVKSVGANHHHHHHHLATIHFAPETEMTSFEDASADRASIPTDGQFQEGGSHTYMNNPVSISARKDHRNIKDITGCRSVIQEIEKTKSEWLRKMIIGARK